MIEAKWQGVLLASAENTVRVEGNHYFPVESLNRKYFRESKTTTWCPWKGTAHYYDLVKEDGEVSKDAAWYYPNPKKAAENIKNHVAFWKDVEIS